MDAQQSKSPKPEWTADEHARMKELQSQRKEARKSASGSEYGSSEFFTHANASVGYEEALNDLLLKGKMRARRTDPVAAKRVEQEHRQQQAALSTRRQSLRRRERRYGARSKVVSRTKTSDLPSARAAYVQLMMDMLETTSRKEQSTMVKNLLEAYGTMTDEAGQPWVWNVFAGDWIQRSVVKAAHLFPLSFGQDTMTYIFGYEGSPEMNLSFNGLWMPRDVEKRFDAYQLAIVPAWPFVKDEPRAWKVLVLNKSIFNAVAYTDVKGATTFGQLHQRVLNFRTRYQPRARYLYFHYLMCMIFMSRASQKAGVQKDELSDLTTPELATAWGSEESYLRENMIRGFIEEMGHALPRQVEEEMLRHAKAQVAGDEMDQMAENVSGMALDSEHEDDDDIDSADDTDSAEGF